MLALKCNNFLGNLVPWTGCIHLFEAQNVNFFSYTLGSIFVYFLYIRVAPLCTLNMNLISSNMLALKCNNFLGNLVPWTGCIHLFEAQNVNLLLLFLHFRVYLCIFPIY
jgi:hypothetical protein